MPRPIADHPLASGCLALLGMPVAAGGVLLLVQATTDPARPAANSVAGIAFTLFGGLLILTAARSVRAGKRESLLRVEFPAQPWRWREEWATGIIPASRHPRPWLAGVIIAACAAVIAGAAMAGMGADRLMRLVVFPLLAVTAVLALVRALRRSPQSARFGRPSLRLETFPGVLGERLRASISLAQAADGFAMRVRCVRESECFWKPGAGNVLWSAEQPVVGRAQPAGGFEATIDQPLPDAVPISDRSIRWAVQLIRPDGKVVETWEIPVFASIGADG